MELIPNTDFGQTLANKSDSDYRRLRDNFDKLCKQPLTLGMFVPCDEDGNVLQDTGLIPSYEQQQYRSAKERVLFEGFEVIHTDKVRTTIQCDFLQLDYKKSFEKFETYNTIEDLTSYKLTLTQTAIKQINE